MKRRKLALWISIALLILIAVVIIVLFRKTNVRPNIILMSVDTLRADHLSCYGYDKNTSPNIDAYSQEFVLFKNAVSAAPVTAPAHMSLFTGLTPIIHRVMNWQEDKSENYRLDDKFATIAEILKNNGYLTVGFHGGGNVSGGLGFDKGFDLYSNKHVKWRTADKNPESLNPIRSWIKKSKEEQKPFFLFLHHYVCHDPYLIESQKFNHHFLVKKVKGLPLRNSKSKTYTRETFWENVDLGKKEHKEHIMALYDGCIYYSDYLFGEVMKILKEENSYDNSIVILLSDHGEEFFEHGDKLHWRLFIETLHVPFLMKFPNSKYRGLKIEKEIRSFDLLPSLLQYLNIKNENFMGGESFIPLITKKGSYIPQIISVAPTLTYLRIHYEEYAYSNQPSLGVHEWLFNRAVDPKEMENLSNNNIEFLKKMRNRSSDIMNLELSKGAKMKSEEKKPAEANEKIIEQLKALGYIK
jgi:arylsulfatase A-like enzyme